MSSQYKENKFSTENLLTPPTSSQNNIDDTVRPNIDHLIKRILVERRKEERKNIFIFTLVLTVAAGIMTFAFYS